MALRDSQYILTKDYNTLMFKAKNKIKTHVELTLRSLSTKAQDLALQIALISRNGISKTLLSHIAHDDLENNIYELIKIGLITTKNPVKSNLTEDTKFEMHEMILNSILEINSPEVIKHQLNFLLDTMNDIAPVGDWFLTRYRFMIQEPEILAAHEELARNGEKYGADQYKIMELKSYLFSFYVQSKDYQRCAEVEKWLNINHQMGENLSLLVMNQRNKASYASLLISNGVYNDFAKSDLRTASEQYNKAISVLKQAPNFRIGLYSATFQLGLLYVNLGQLDEAQVKITEVDKLLKDILTQKKEDEVERNKIEFLKAKLSIAKGEYQIALEQVQKLIDAVEADQIIKGPMMTNISAYILKAEGLSHLGRYEEALSLAKSLLSQSKSIITLPHEVRSRIFVQLSRAEGGLGHQDEALDYANKAIESLNNEYNNDELISNNLNYAACLEAKADALIKTGANVEALNFYSKALSTYFERYKGYMNNVIPVKAMLNKAIDLSMRVEDKKYYELFSRFLVLN